MARPATGWVLQEQGWSSSRALRKNSGVQLRLKVILHFLPWKLTLGSPQPKMFFTWRWVLPDCFLRSLRSFHAQTARIGVLQGCCKLALNSGSINRASSLPGEVRGLYLVPVLTAFLWENRKPAVNIRIFHGLLSDALKLRGCNHIPVIFTYRLEWWLSS